VVPIGVPWPGRSAHVVDEAGRLQPPGAPGELWLGGLLARGYLGRPEVTAERFVPDPWGEAPGGRLYRTGDQVRRRADGVLDFIGRVDGQVKVRGFRIELAEIEAALLAHPRVEAAAVVALAAAADTVGIGGAGGVGRLVAYLSPAGLPVEDLRAHLRRHLPEPMMPALFVGLAELPLGPGGKVDRRALPPPPEAGAGAGFVPPRTPMEEIVAGIWRRLLGVSRVGAMDNFFDLGGHSHQGIRLLAHLREELGVELAVRSLFEAPTLGGFAGVVLAEMVRQVGSEAVEEVFAAPEE